MGIYRKRDRLIAAMLCVAIISGFFAAGPAARAAEDSSFTQWDCVGTTNGPNTSSKYPLSRTYGGTEHPDETEITIEFDLVHTFEGNAWVVFDNDKIASTSDRPVWLGIRQALAQNDFAVFESATDPKPIEGITPSIDSNYHIKLVVDLTAKNYVINIDELNGDGSLLNYSADYRRDAGAVETNGLNAIYFYKATGSNNGLDYIKNLVVNGEPQGLLDSDYTSELYQRATVTGGDMTLYKDVEVTSAPTVTASVLGCEFAPSPDPSKFTFSALPAGVAVESVARNAADPGKVDIVLGGTPTVEQAAASIGTLTIDKSQLTGMKNNPAPAQDIVSAAAGVQITVLNDKISTKSIALDRNSLSLYAGRSSKLVAAVTPSNSMDGIIWSSSDESVVTVTQGGLVAAVAPGSATVKAVSNGHEAACAVTVSALATDADNLMGYGTFEQQFVITDSSDPLYTALQDKLENGNGQLAPGKTVADYWPQGRLYPVLYQGNGATGSFSFGYDTANKKEGSQSLKMDMSGANRYVLLRATEPLENGKMYKLSFWYKTQDLATTASGETSVPLFRRQYMPANWAAGTAGTQTNMSGIPTGTKDWTLFTDTFTVPAAGVNNLQLVIQIANQSGKSTSGTLWLDDLKLVESIPPVTVTLNTTSRELVQGDTFRLTANVTNAADTSVTWSSSDTSVATVATDGEVTAIAAGQATITATSVQDVGASGTCSVTVVGRGPTTSIAMNKASTTIAAGRHEVLRAVCEPRNTSDTTVWASSDESVATVLNGVVTAKREGITTVTATSGGFSATCAVTVGPYVTDEFDKLRDSWADYLLPAGYDVNDVQIAAILEGYADKAERYWMYMNKSANGNGSSTANQLWNGAGGLGGLSGAAAGFEVYYDYLYAMTLAFAAEGSRYYHDVDLLDDIIFGMDFMDSYLFTKSPKWSISNWWERTIGMPKAVNDIVAVLWDYLPVEKRDKYNAKVKSYAYTGDSSGSQYIAANRVDECKIAIVNAVLMKDGSQLTKAVNNIITDNAKVLEQVGSGNGIYYDGSYVEHNTVAYTSSYGLVMAEGLSQIIYLLSDAETAAYKPPQELLTRLDAAMQTTFLPHVFRGNRLASSTGRAISRQDQNFDGAVASRYAALILMLSEGYDAATANEYRGTAKTYLQENGAIFTGNTNIGNHVKFKHLLANAGIPAVAEQEGVFTFNRMARTTIKRSDYLLDFAMHSNRIADYEGGNKENYRGFHTGDGMMYLYNADLSQFQGNYWATVDGKRLPGTTVDTHTMDKVSTSAKGGTGATTNGKITWAGASSLDDFAAVGFLLNKSNITAAESAKRSLNDPTTVMDLKAAKSWFIFDNEIVALGSGITSGTGRTVETTIENRKITGYNPGFFVDGVSKVPAMGSSDTVATASWAWLEGNVPGADIGYYFGDDTTVNLLRESRTDSWSSVNGNKFTVDTSPVSDSYLTMYLDHGTDPVNGGYEYAILPGYSRAEAAAYAQNPGYEVLSNTADFHAVHHNALNITALNHYGSDPRTANGITVGSEGSVMVRWYPIGYADADLAGTIKVTANRILTSGSVVIILDKGIYGAYGTELTQKSADSNVTVADDGEGNTVITVGYVSARPQDTFEVVLNAALTPIPTPAPSTPTVSVKENAAGETVVTLTGANPRINESTQAALREKNETRPIVIKSRALNVQIPVGAFGEGDDLNARLVNPAAQKGNAIEVTLADGTTVILPFTVVGGGKASYLADLSGNYRIIDNTHSFSDVSEDHFAAGEIGNSSARDLFAGTGGGKFQPTLTVSRAMLATVLSRMDTQSTPGGDAAGVGGVWYSDGAGWAVEKGILSGTGAAFNGDAPATREQIVVALCRFASFLGKDVSVSEADSLGGFEDADGTQPWAEPAMKWAVKQGLLTGKPTGDGAYSLDAGAELTRAEFAVLVDRFTAYVLGI